MSRRRRSCYRTPTFQHYWNPSGVFGRLLSQVVGVRNGDKQVYAWDVWLIYGPEATWVGTDPPRPRLLMHQLGALRGSREYTRCSRSCQPLHARLLSPTRPINDREE
jgi:hypothetical protein